MDSILSINVPFPRIQIITSSGETLKTVGDSLGNYKIRGNISSKKSIVMLESDADNQNSSRIFIDTLLNKGETLKINIKMLPVSICSDTFLPAPILFKKNKTQLNSDEQTSLINWAKESSLTLEELFSNMKLQITAYSSYQEKDIIAKERGWYIYKIFIENGFRKENIEVIIKDKEDYNYFQYADGCHYYFLKSEVVRINKNLIDKTTGLDEQNKLQTKRQVVVINWKYK